MGSKPKAPPQPTSNIPQTLTGQWAKDQVYPLIQQGMSGGGLLPQGLQSLRQQEARQGLTSSFGQARQELGSDLSRILHPGDTGPRNYLMNQMDRQKLSAQDALTRGFRMEQLTDQQGARDMGFGAWGNEMRMGIGSMQAYNQAESGRLANEAQYGTFGTNVAGGLGSMLTSAHFAPKMAGGG